MWPSLATAERVADVANIFFIGSLVVGVVATITIVWMTNVKERYWDQDRQASAERIAALTTQTAEANAQALEAQLALGKFREVPSGMRLEFGGAISGNMRLSFQAARSIG